MKRLYGIAGDGRASRHLRRYFALLGIPYKLWHRRSGKSPEAVLAPCTAVFVLLPDAAIEPFITAHPFLKDKTVIHFSGSLSVPGAFAMHPFRPLASRPLTLSEYRAVPFALEPGVSLRRLVPEFRNPSFTVRPERKPLYHALCVLGANLPVLLWSRALAGLSAFGVSRAAATAYFRSSLDNFAADPAGALTGPLVRGDAATVSANIKALGRDPYARIYSSFADAYLKHGKRHGRGDRVSKTLSEAEACAATRPSEEGRPRCGRPRVLRSGLPVRAQDDHYENNRLL